MAEVLRPSSEFNPQELGARLFTIYHTGETAEILAARSIHGFGARYGADTDTAVANVIKGQGNTTAEHYVILGSDGDVHGAASVYAGLPLGRSRLPLPGAIARGDKGFALPGMFTTYPHAVPNIQALVVAGKEDLLWPAYDELFARHRTRAEFPSDCGVLSKRAWTLEVSPRSGKMHRAQHAAHEAIKAAGLEAVTTGWFDDLETSRAPIPRSTLYAAPFRPRRTTRQQLKGLRTGTFTFGEKFDAFMEEDISRNPHG